jgi:hypothetical protein
MPESLFYVKAYAGKEQAIHPTQSFVEEREVFDELRYANRESGNVHITLNGPTAT